MFICCFACLGLEFVVVTVVGEWGKGEGVFSGRLGGGVQVRGVFSGEDRLYNQHFHRRTVAIIKLGLTVPALFMASHTDGRQRVNSGPHSDCCSMLSDPHTPSHSGQKFHMHPQ